MPHIFQKSHFLGGHFWLFTLFLEKHAGFWKNLKISKFLKIWFLRSSVRAWGSHRKSWNYCYRHFRYAGDVSAIFRAIKSTMTEDQDSQISNFKVLRHMYGKWSKSDPAKIGLFSPKSGSHMHVFTFLWGNNHANCLKTTQPWPKLSLLREIWHMSVNEYGGAWDWYRIPKEFALHMTIT